MYRRGLVLADMYQSLQNSRTQPPLTDVSVYSERAESRIKLNSVEKEQQGSTTFIFFRKRYHIYPYDRHVLVALRQCLSDSIDVLCTSRSLLRGWTCYRSHHKPKFFTIIELSFFSEKTPDCGMFRQYHTLIMTKADESRLPGWRA